MLACTQCNANPQAVESPIRAVITRKKKVLVSAPSHQPNIVRHSLFKPDANGPDRPIRAEPELRARQFHLPPQLVGEEPEVAGRMPELEDAVGDGAGDRGAEGLSIPEGDFLPLGGLVGTGE